MVLLLLFLFIFLVYLQSLEIIGFKSFAPRTRLVFEPGITAIVGPNGCGKSNISDAIRWVLGEQRPTALRSSAMTDVIFNGTDSHKPLNMTEVSITFADCEKELGTEYHEVTVSRRVFRTGEGQYFINKTPCRLRDIHRLFMGTGIGTTSYSVMAQGQIDAILSSRPEDRRAIFEEASGITRFRADRKEAVRKLEQTDANLVRIADVIRELHRQIGSLQRQAGKARRYKELQADLRKLDLFATARKIVAFRSQIEALSRELTAASDSLENVRAQVETAEQINEDARAAMIESERLIGAALEAAMELQGRCNQAADSIRVNRQRADEYRAWIARDEREIAETAAIRASQEQLAAESQAQLEALEGELAGFEEELRLARAEFDARRGESQSARDELQRLRNESAEAERLHVSLQNELSASEQSARESVFKNERLLAEKDSGAAQAKSLTTRLDELEGEAETLAGIVDADIGAVASLEQKIVSLRAELRAKEQEMARLESQSAVHRARIKLLKESDAANKAASGAKLLLDPANPLALPERAALGRVAEMFSAPKELRRALEAVLHPYFDAVALSGQRHALDAAAKLCADEKAGGAVMVCGGEGGGGAGDLREGAGEGGNAAALANGVPLLSKLSIAPEFADAAKTLLGNVALVDEIAADSAARAPGIIRVTPAGIVAHPNGVVEIWKPEGGEASNPLARHMLIEDAEREIEELETARDDAEYAATAAKKNLDASASALETARVRLEQSRRTAAQKEGEENAARRDLAKAKERLAAVEREIASLAASFQATTQRGKEITERLNNMGDSRQRVADAAAAQSAEVQRAEEGFLTAQTRLTETRLSHVSAQHRVETNRAQLAAAAARVAELARMIKGRENGVATYHEGIDRIAAENAAAEEKLSALEDEAQVKKQDIAAKRAAKETRQTLVDQSQRELNNLRHQLDRTQETHGKTELALAEADMRRQNVYEKLATDWHLTPEQLVAEPPPDWDGAAEPTVADAESRAADIRQKMEEMGPVNLVAIEEYQQIEERHAELSEQERDLSSAKTKLFELIKDLDRQSTELFKETFEKANVNFQAMFTRLFDGGTAQLTLMDDTDMLECGIDIIARPPGKKPQTISLLSGGERTMTAVALLFAIYQIKPSPFALLDELDAALDDSNIGRFVGVLRDFLDQSQFLIITHNQHTIAGADIVYGVTQKERGISTIVSMRLKRMGVEAPQAESLPEVAAPPPSKKRRQTKSGE